MFPVQRTAAAWAGSNGTATRSPAVKPGPVLCEVYEQKQGAPQRKLCYLPCLQAARCLCNQQLLRQHRARPGQVSPPSAALAPSSHLRGAPLDIPRSAHFPRVQHVLPGAAPALAQYLIVPQARLSRNIAVRAARGWPSTMHRPTS